MMLCEKCKKNQATVFYQENINGNQRSYALCNECASTAETGYSSYGDLFSVPSLGNQLFGGLFGHTAPQKGKTCPACGATFSDFRTNGKVGCPECYAAFSEELGATIRSIHGNVNHVGRAPARFRKNREKQDRLVDLKTQLKSAIEQENFELAATLRDEIRTLESNGKEE